MIGWLRGRVVDVSFPGTVVVDVGGVGYEVSVATLEGLTRGVELELYVHTQVRADAIVLFAFLDARDRELFLRLLAVPGVGPSTALAALRTMSAEELRAAIDDGDVKRVSSIPGVGAKTAGRIVLELKGKLVEVAAPSERPGSRDLEDALRSLGYSAGEVRAALEGVDRPEDESSALRVALQRLGRR